MSMNLIKKHLNRIGHFSRSCWNVLLGIAMVVTATGSLPLQARVLPEPSVNLPRDISVDGHHIDHELWIITIAISVIFVICFGFMLYSFAKHGKSNKAHYDHGNSKASAVFVLVITMVIFVLIDGTGFVNATEYLNEHFWNEEYHDQELHPEAVRVEVNARQWAWQMRYEGRDGKFMTPDDIVDLNVIRVPVDTPIAIQLTSSDVIHAFSLPNARVKADAVPGQVSKFWFEIDGEKVEQYQSHEYDLVCQQHCGTHHYKMKGTLIVMERDEYERWYEEASIQSELDYQENPKGLEIAKASEKLAKKQSKFIDALLEQVLERLEEQADEAASTPGWAAHIDDWQETLLELAEGKLEKYQEENVLGALDNLNNELPQLAAQAWTQGGLPAEVSQMLMQHIADSKTGANKTKTVPYSPMAEWKEKYGPHWGWDWALANKSKS